MITIILLYIIISIYVFVWHILLSLYIDSYSVYCMVIWDNLLWHNPTRFYKLICLVFYPIVFLIVFSKKLLKVISVYLFNN